MEYVEFEEWKKFKKEKKYKEATEILMDEIATNIVRVHNFYSDIKYDENKNIGIAFGFDFLGQKSNGENIEEMTPYRYIRIDLRLLYKSYCDILDDSVWGTFKELLKDAEKLRKKLIREFLRIKEM